MIPPEARARLAEKMEERRLELRLTWREVAEAGEISYEVVRNVRNGRGTGIAPLTKRGIDTALQWEAGSVDGVLAGGEPELAPPAPGLPRMSPEQERAARPHLGPINRRIGEVAMNTGTPLDQLTGAMLFDSLADQLNWDQLRGFGYPPAVAAVYLAVLRADDAGASRNHQGSAAGLPAPGHVAVTIRA